MTGKIMSILKFAKMEVTVLIYIKTPLYGASSFNFFVLGDLAA